MWLLGAVALAGDLQAGLSLRAAGDLQAATAAFERATDQLEGPVPWIELAVTRSWTSDLDGALAAYEQALHVEPDHLGARVGRARVLAWQGHRARAEALLADLPGEEARVELARVQLVRRRDRAARRTQATIAGPSSEDLQALRRSIRRTRVDLEGSLAASGSSVSAAVAHEVSAETTLRASARHGLVLDQPLSSATTVVGVGTTWAARGWWLSPGVRWENGLWLEARAAHTLGPIVVDGGADLETTDHDWRLQAGVSHEGRGWRVSGRGFLSAQSGAVMGEVGLTGTWQVMLRGVTTHGTRGDTMAVGVGWAGSALELHAEGGYGTGVLAGPRASLRVGIRY